MQIQEFPPSLVDEKARRLRVLDENTAKLNEKARRLSKSVKQILDHSAPAGDQPADPAATVPDGVQVAIGRAKAGGIYLEFSRPIERLSLSMVLTRVMIGRLRDVVNGIEPVRKKRKK